MSHFKSVDEYIGSFDGIVQERLREMRKIVKTALPDAQERISYNIPAYFIKEHLVIYYAGFKDHLGMYPGRTNSNAYNKLAAKYAFGKSTARFSHSEPIPNGVVKDFIKVRLAELKLK